MPRRRRNRKRAATIRGDRRGTRSSALAPPDASGEATSTIAGPPQQGAHELEAQVEDLLARGISTRALAIAKGLHRSAPSEASRTLLIRSYLARAEALAAKGLDREAIALLELLEQNHAEARDPVRSLRLRFAVKGREVDDAVAPLADPDLAPATREEIEDAIRKHLCDPSALASAASLPENHPLRRAAGAITDALARVTTRSVTDVEVALPEVSRRSPLAPWKLLVRALAAFYRCEDEECERSLAAIPTDSAPARLVPELRAMTAAVAPAAPTRLYNRVLGRPDKLRSALGRLDAAFAAEDPFEVPHNIEAAVRQVRSEAPELLERLLQWIEIYAIVHMFDPEWIEHMIGRAPKRDAGYLRRLAKSIEGAPGLPHAFAAPVWISFLKAAVAEGQLASEGLEAAAIYRHTASLLEGYAADEIEELFREAKDLDPTQRSQPGGRRSARGRRSRGAKASTSSTSEHRARDPLWLHARACEWDSSPDGFRAWIESARSRGDDKQMERAAEAWTETHPNDPHPLLIRMQSAESRGALRKALGFLEQAAQRNPLDSSVLHARRRLQIKTAQRHLAGNKPKLLAGDIAALEQTIAELGSKESMDSHLALSALRCAHAALAQDPAGFRLHQDALSQEVGDARAAELLLRAVARLDLRRGKEGAEPGHRRTRSSKKSAQGTDASLLDGAARVCSLCRALELDVEFMETEVRSLCRALRGTIAETLESGALCALAECALQGGEQQLAYLASHAGLARRDAYGARFLLLRGRSLEGFDDERALCCVDAVIALAQRDRNARLLDDAVDVRRDLSDIWSEGPQPSAHPEAVFDAELEHQRPPQNRRGAHPHGSGCPCRRCELQRGGRGHLDLEDEDPVEDLDLSVSFLASIEGAPVAKLQGLPPRLMRLLLEAAMKYGATPRHIPWMSVVAERNPELHAKIRAEVAVCLSSLAPT